ncbi:hypothetical protein [Caviibacterium pharyngocola]|uniref:Uncharacterized protein n=1 Tax=Caviibacterium pharyngocola TaxID=28159 RepID=A0A2M8RY26_9PAST|nr:hypothetical protein [Caviibacterium pharyngocola]PJG83788.1 hypothetical protein CVP04_01465 [Caviibacterium pharyngocola]
MEIQPKICLEVIFDDEETLSKVSIGAKTDVLGGKVSRVNFQGDTFDDLEWFMGLFDDNQMQFLCARNNTVDRMKSAIYKALDKLINEIIDEEEIDNDIPY